MFKKNNILKEYIIGMLEGVFKVYSPLPKYPVPPGRDCGELHLIG
jgi:hypothetical protein